MASLTMSKQTPPIRARRCLGCGCKTPPGSWENGGTECPICNFAFGFSESTHGAIRIKEIPRVRGEFQAKIGKEREPL